DTGSRVERRPGACRGCARSPAAQRCRARRATARPTGSVPDRGGQRARPLPGCSSQSGGGGVMRDWVEQVKEHVDILEIAGRYTALKRVGRQFRGLCPFHQEKTPSFYVSPDKGLYKCFGCGEGGDAFTLLMKLEAIDFMEAARKLAAEYGIEIQERTRKISHDERRRL